MTAIAATARTPRRSPATRSAVRRPSTASAEQGLVEREAPALAHGADGAHRLDETLAHALAGHLDEAELADVEHLDPGLVTGERLPEGLHDLGPVLPDLHVDEVDDDD